MVATWMSSGYVVVPYTVKKVFVFPAPSRNVTNQTLPDWELLNYSWPERLWLLTSWLETGNTITFFTVYRLLYVNLKLSSAKLSHFSNIWKAFGAIMFLLEPKEGDGRSVGLFYCFILSVTVYSTVYIHYMSSGYTKKKYMRSNRWSSVYCQVKAICVHMFTWVNFVISGKMRRGWPDFVNPPRKSGRILN
jgi:hypothetical protein